jgi:hypothetical protein
MTSARLTAVGDDVEQDLARSGDRVLDVGGDEDVGVPRGTAG